MYMIAKVSQYVAVASFAEAWIEIFLSVPKSGTFMSPPSRRRGLKYNLSYDYVFLRKSPPSRRRGLKCEYGDYDNNVTSRLLRGGVD